MISTTLRVCAGAAVALTLVACDGPREQTLTIGETRRAPKPVKVARPLTTAERFGGRSSGATPVTPPTRALSFTWKTPEGWTKRQATSMRTVNLVVPPEGECYVTALPGRAGGITENVNRWRKQMSLAPLSREEIAALPQRPLLGVKGVEIVLDGTFSGMGGAPREGSRMRGIIATFQGQTVFVKFVGPRATVEQQAAQFEGFVASLAVAGTTGTSEGSPHGPQGPGPVGPVKKASPFSSLVWRAPETWKRVPSSSGMRLVTFSIEGLSTSECYLTVLQGEAGGEAANLERWQQQLGLPPLGEAGLAALERVTVFGKPRALFEGVGTFEGQANTYLAGCAVFVDGQTLFVKLVVPGGGKGAGRASFLEFLTSLRV